MSTDMLIPRPSNPPFVTYNTNTEGGLVEHATCSDVPGCLLGAWRSTFRLCAAVGWPTEPEKCHQIRSMSSAHLLCSSDEQRTNLCARNVPLLHTSTRHLPNIQVYHYTLWVFIILSAH